MSDGIHLTSQDGSMTVEYRVGRRRIFWELSPNMETEEFLDTLSDILEATGWHSSPPPVQQAATEAPVAPVVIDKPNPNRVQSEPAPKGVSWDAPLSEQSELPLF